MSNKCMICGTIPNTVHKIKLFNFNSVTRSSGPFEGVAKSRRFKWLSAIDKNEADIAKYKIGPFICSRHFIEGEPSKIHQSHHPDWIPTQNLERKKFPKTMSNKVSAYDSLTKLKSSIQSVSIPKEVKGEPVFAGRGTKCRVNLENEFRSTKVSQLLDYEAIRPEEKTCNNSNVSAFPIDEAQPNQPTEAANSLTLVSFPDNIAECVELLAGQNQLIENLKVKLSHFDLSDQSFIDNDTKTQYYTGFSSYSSLEQFHQSVAEILPDFSSKGIGKFGIVVLVLMKLRFDFPFEYLCSRFQISYFDVYEVFYQALTLIAPRFQLLPSNRTVPDTLKSAFGDLLAAIVDIIEIDVDVGSGPWKSVKFLIAFAASGYISFVSKPFDGNSTDKLIVEESGWLNKQNNSDLILSLRGSLAEDITKPGSTRHKVYLYGAGRNSLMRFNYEATKDVRRTILDYMDGWLSMFKYLTHKQPEFFVKNPNDFLYKCVFLCAYLNNHVE